MSVDNDNLNNINDTMDNKNDEIKIVDVTEKDTELNELKDKITELNDKIYQLEDTIKWNKNDYIINIRNMQNDFNKKLEIEQKFYVEKFAKEIIEVYKQLKLSQSFINNINDDLKDGIQMTINILLDKLAKFEIKLININIGDKFDPNMHLAVRTDSKYQNNIIGEVIEDGFTIYDRLLTPTMVIVGKD